MVDQGNNEAGVGMMLEERTGDNTGQWQVVVCHDRATDQSRPHPVRRRHRIRG